MPRLFPSFNSLSNLSPREKKQMAKLLGLGGFILIHANLYLENSRIAIIALILMVAALSLNKSAGTQENNSYRHGNGAAA